MMVLTDQTGEVHEVTKSPQRIVCLVPSLTELLCDMGLEPQVVGVTKFCVHPVYLCGMKTVVGGTKKVHVEKIRHLQPDIIICNKEENTAEMVAQLRGLCSVWVTDIASIDDCLDCIRSMGLLFNRRMEARKLVDRITSARDRFVSDYGNLPGRRAAYFIWKNPYMLAGRDTFIGHMMAVNNFENIAEGERYPEIGLEAVRRADPELVLLSSEPYPFSDADAFEIGRFTHHGKTIFVDGEMFSWYGSRIIKAFEYFRQLQQRLG